MTRESAKRARELAGLRFLYNERSCWSSIHADSPDFVLQTNSTSAPFGVEITEIHSSGSAARLMHMPGYLAHVIGGGPIQHKDDADLKIGPVKFTSPDGQKVVTGHAVERGNMAIDDYITALAHTISAKATKAEGYRSGLSHVNLVVVDHATPFVLTTPDVANSIIFADAIWSAVITSPFNEIFLVTRLLLDPASGAKQVYLPLRQLLLASVTMLFRGALQKYTPTRRLRTWSRRAHALCDYLVHKGNPAILRGPAASPEIVVGTIGIRGAANGGLAIHDHLDIPSGPATHPRCRSAPWRNPDFEVAFQAYRGENWIQFTHAFPVRVGSG